MALKEGQSENNWQENIAVMASFHGSMQQCQFYVLRKKRLCRMTVRPGHQYCGEHEPPPSTGTMKSDIRVPCPLDSKHTCFESKLEKHLTICNARQTALPSYITHNINEPVVTEVYPRKPLSEIPNETLSNLISKVNQLYDQYLKGQIVTLPEWPIHETILQEFTESDRTESSLRHLRQVSGLLHITEHEGLVENGTCYVELGAGKGQLSYYACVAWCDRASAERSSVVLVDRAALRHKRDNKLQRAAVRLRADLAHVALGAVPIVTESDAVVGLAKHLCGVATDYALRCMTSNSVLKKSRGLVLATCCHHRCTYGGYVGIQHLQELGINGEELNAMFGIVSWATCGDGRSRELRKKDMSNVQVKDDSRKLNETDRQNNIKDFNTSDNIVSTTDSKDHFGKIDVLVENKKDMANVQVKDDLWKLNETDRQNIKKECNTSNNTVSTADSKDHIEKTDVLLGKKKDDGDRMDDSFSTAEQDIMKHMLTATSEEKSNAICSSKEHNTLKITLSTEEKERIGRQAKALLDWGRVLYLREKGFDAYLCYYVPLSVSLENMCIVAKK